MNGHEQSTGHTPPDGDSVISLIRQIQQGQLSARNLSMDDRQRCVEHLTGEGYSVAEMSEILKFNKRTIARDRAEVRRANALYRSPGMAEEYAGYAVAQAEQSIHRLMKLYRDRSTDTRDRIECIRASWTITNQLLERLQSLGFLPNAATEIHGHITHHVNSLPDSAQIQEELRRLEVITKDGNVAIGNAEQRKALLGEIDTMNRQAEQLVLVDRIDQITHIVKNAEDQDHGQSD